MLNFRQNKLIRHETRFWPKLIDILLTLLAWYGFFWLFIYGLFKTLETSRDRNITIFTDFFGQQLTTIFAYLLIMLLNASILILWANFNKWRFRIERRTQVSALEKEKLLTSFQISDEVFQALQQNKVITVNNDSNGAIHYIKVLNKKVIHNEL